MYFRANCYAGFNQAGFYLDTDMLVIHALSPIMALDFDIAVTKRKNAVKDPNGVNISDAMPYNGGFVAVKDPTFWPEVAERMSKMDSESQRWYGDQLAIAQAAKKRRVLELPDSIYNYPVKSRGEDLSGRWVAHFKGAAKEWMHDY